MNKFDATTIDKFYKQRGLNYSREQMQYLRTR